MTKSRRLRMTLQTLDTRETRTEYKFNHSLNPVILFAMRDVNAKAVKIRTRKIHI